MCAIGCDRFRDMCKGYEVIVDGAKTTCRAWLVEIKTDGGATGECNMKVFPDKDAPEYQ